MLRDADLAHLRRAIELAGLARKNGNHPFGALLVGPAGDVLAEAQNTVVTERDCTGHAELNLVRLASSRYSPDVLAKSTLFTSAEPCAMCAGATFWGGIGRVVYALSEEDLYALTGRSIHELPLKIPCREVFSRSGRAVQVEGPALEEEAKRPHIGFWESLP